MLFKVRHGKCTVEKRRTTREISCHRGKPHFRNMIFGIFLCMRKSTFGNLEALPPSYLVPLAIFFVNVNSLRNICKRHCYLAKVQSGTIWTSVFLSSLAKKVSKSLPQVYVTITISTRRYYET